MTTAMVKQLAARAVMPPSPKRPACTTRAMVIAITAAQGPRRIAISVAPTAWPVDPPTTGTLNIMMTKENAAPSASSGICLVRSVRLTLRAATTQMGIITSHSTANVCGPR